MEWTTWLWNLGVCMHPPAHLCICFKYRANEQFPEKYQVLMTMDETLSEWGQHETARLNGEGTSYCHQNAMAAGSFWPRCSKLDGDFGSYSTSHSTLSILSHSLRRATQPWDSVILLLSSSWHEQNDFRKRTFIKEPTVLGVPKEKGILIYSTPLWQSYGARLIPLLTEIPQPSSWGVLKHVRTDTHCNKSITNNFAWSILHIPPVVGKADRPSGERWIHSKLHTKSSWLLSVVFREQNSWRDENSEQKKKEIQFNARNPKERQQPLMTYCSISGCISIPLGQITVITLYSSFTRSWIGA